jgi:hypothetical protein
MVSTALFQTGIIVPNGWMQAQLSMGGDVFNIPDGMILSRLPIPAVLCEHSDERPDRSFHVEQFRCGESNRQKELTSTTVANTSR